jgi:hypothetical protein
MNFCNNNGICNDGFCSCNTGFGGADCSGVISTFTETSDLKVSTQGFGWYYFGYSGADSSTHDFSFQFKID